MLREELEHAHRLATLGTLTAGIAHEINNVLTPVLAYAQLAVSNPGDTALQRKAAEKALAGVQTATGIAQAMLGFAGNPSESIGANVPQVLQNALETMGRNPDKDRISIRVEVPADLHLAIKPLALQQVFINVLTNAWNALKTSNRAKGGTITITLQEQSDGTALLRIIDDGPGIPHHVAAGLFQPFATTRLQGSASVRSSGTGLGLTICRRLIEDAGGTIAVNFHPEIKRGTSIDIILPLPSTRRAQAS